MKNKKILFFIVIYIFVNLFVIMNWKNNNTIDNYESINYKEPSPYVHFSIDDTIEIFEDLTKNKENYQTIFDNGTLKFLKECNETYEAKFSMYCFYEFNGICLENCTDKFKKEFQENSEWLKFGFHALNNIRDYSKLSEEETKKDYQQVIGQLKRIVGEKSITTVIRMEKFVCNKNNAKVLGGVEYGITGLLGADTMGRQDYYLNKKLNYKLFEKEIYYDNSIGITIYNTDLRVEKIENVYEEIDKIKEDKNIIVFTHEGELNGENKNKIVEICEITTQNGYIYDFPKIQLEE